MASVRPVVSAVIFGLTPLTLPVLETPNVLLATRGAAHSVCIVTIRNRQ